LIQGSEDHKNLLEEFKNKNLQMSLEQSDKIKSQEETLSDWNDKTITQSHSMQERIGKFLLEELRRDTPTGKSFISDFYV
jgi:FtsZ-binding cell division protein ZapB